MLDPIQTTSPSFISWLKAIASIFCFFLEKTSPSFSEYRFLPDLQKVSASPQHNEEFSNVSGIFSDLTADNFSVESFNRCKIKSFSMMYNEFYVTLTQSTGSDTVLSSCLAANSAEMIIFQKDGDKNQSLVMRLGAEYKCLSKFFWGSKHDKVVERHFF